MKGVYFIPFPKPSQDAEKCKRWLRACSRLNFDISSITKYTYICSAHFVEPQGPSDEHPDPIPANYTIHQASTYFIKSP